MPITKEFTDPSTHVTASFWDLSSLSNDQINGNTKCTLGLYFSESARDAGAKPIYEVDFTINGILERAECLAYIVANYSDFSGSVIT